MPILALAIAGAPGWIAIVTRLPDGDAGWPAILHYASNAAAMLGTSLFAASFVLMLRVSWLERLLGGLDNLYFSHHVAGVSAFLVLLLHPVALGLAHLANGDAAAALAATIPSFEYPALLAGWAALLWLMAMMIGTFHVRFSYVTWKWLHASSGLAFLVSLVHVIALRPSLRLEHVMLAIWIAVGVAALVGRILIDRSRIGGRRYLVSAVRHLADTIVEVKLRPLEEPLQFSPGQFAFVAFYDSQDYRGCAEYHPFTVVSKVGVPELQFLAKALGDCTMRMQSLQPGVPARVQGPFGTFAPGSAAGRPQIWIAGGIGITPFLSFAESLTADGPPIDLYYAAATRADAIGLHAIEQAAARQRRLRLFTVFADVGEILTADRIATESGSLEGKEFFMCGPAGMVQSISSQLRALGVPGSALHSERFDFR